MQLVDTSDDSDGGQMSDPTGVGALSEQVVRLTRASSAIRNQMATRGQDPVEWAAYGLLFQLANDGPKRSSALAESACVDPSTVSRQVGQLVTAGLVERRSDPEDGRATLLAATPAGREVYAAKLERRLRLFSRLVQGWPEKDVVTFTDLLQRLNDSITALRPTLLAEMGPQTRPLEETE